MQNFRSLGGLEVSNSLTGIGTEGGRELGTFCVLSRVASQLKTGLKNHKNVACAIKKKTAILQQFGTFF